MTGPANGEARSETGQFGTTVPDLLRLREWIQGVQGHKTDNQHGQQCQRGAQQGQANSKGQPLTARRPDRERMGSFQKAVIAVAQDLLRLAHCVLKLGTPCEENRGRPVTEQQQQRLLGRSCFFRRERLPH